MKKYLFILILLLIPVNVNALDISQNDFDVAKSGKTSNGISYSKEYDAYYFEEDGEYVLTSDIIIEESTIILEEGKFVFDLNGKTLLRDTDSEDRTWFINVYTTDLTIKGNGKILCDTKMRYLIVSMYGSSITIEDGIFDGRIGVSGDKKTEKLKIKSGTFGSLSAVKANVTIDDAIFNANDLEREAIYVDALVNLVINGGRYESQYGVIKSYTDEDKHDTSVITINGGTFIGKENYGLNLSGNEQIIITNGVFEDNKDKVTIDSDNKQDIAKLIKAGNGVLKYSVINGANSRYIVDKDDKLSFMIDIENAYIEDEEKFIDKVYVDNKKIDKANYTSETGGIITLKKEYLDNLRRGNHTLKVVIQDGGIAVTEFNITKKLEVLEIVCIVIAGISIWGISILFRKKKIK